MKQISFWIARINLVFVYFRFCWPYFAAPCPKDASWQLSGWVGWGGEVCGKLGWGWEHGVEWGGQSGIKHGSFHRGLPMIAFKHYFWRILVGVMTTYSYRKMKLE